MLRQAQQPATFVIIINPIDKVGPYVEKIESVPRTLVVVELVETTVIDDVLGGVVSYSLFPYNKNMKHLSHSEADTYTIAGHVLDGLVPESTTATILTLQGDLGAGKTAFTKALAKHLGITDTLVSPTFVLAKYYDIPGHSHWKRLIHIDAYRLDSGEDLRKLNFEREFSEPTNLMVVEWPEQVADIIPEHAHTLSFTYVDEKTREITQ